MLFLRKRFYFHVTTFIHYDEYDLSGDWKELFVKMVGFREIGAVDQLPDRLEPLISTSPSKERSK